MNWAYDVNELQKTYERKQDHVIAMNKLAIKLRKHQEKKMEKWKEAQLED